MYDRFGAYFDENLTIQPYGEGRLSGLSFSVKDVFAVKGHRNAAGNPDWLRTHEAAETNAKAIDLLLSEGACLSGITHTDELMYDLTGVNIHYGTPVNPSAKERIPGGSSSGSAVAVASGTADFALGTDTGGSVRIPSSYCGIYGFRPTHGSVPVEGVIPLAPSFDTVGWMSKNASKLLAVGKVLLSGDTKTRFCKVYYPEDIWNVTDAACVETLRAFVPAIVEELGTMERLVLDRHHRLETWMDTFRIWQALEIWRTHGEWVEKVKPRFEKRIAERLNWSATLVEEDHKQELLIRDQVRNQLGELLQRDSILVIPTAPGPAPLLTLSQEELESQRFRTLNLCCIAGLAGLPQVTLPFGSAMGAPVGLSIIAGRGCDLSLLELANHLSERCLYGVN